MKILNIVGARPNFMKIAPLHKVFQQYKHIVSKVVHTGQHYDEKMSSIFFDQLALPKPDYYLGVGSGTHAEVTARIMIEFEKIILKEKPDLVVVVGDVNSTLACALVSKKMNIKLAHVEAGLRSGDREMPEELNRVLTDSIADYLFVTEESGMKHLQKEGLLERSYFVGNVMIDSLIHYRKEAAQISLLNDLNLKPRDYILMTMHRPVNVDQYTSIKRVVDLVRALSQLKKIVFPLHPRTLNSLKKQKLLEEFKAIPNLIVLEPQGYLEFLHLMENTAAIVTDSGGIQEESTYLKVPCFTIRTTTERPITVEIGTNQLIEKFDVALIVKEVQASLENKKFASAIPPLWDGKTADRIVEVINAKFQKLDTPILEVNVCDD